MITAVEAATRTIELIKNHEIDELKTIDERINKSIKKGERSCYYDGIISSVARQELERLGYRVEVGRQYNEYYVNECYVIIRW